MERIKKLSETVSVCPDCLKELPAERVLYENGVYLEKACPEHGNFRTLIWEGSEESYLTWSTGDKCRDAMINARPADKGCPHDCGLCAEHERLTCCALLEITKRCNLSCPVCFASAGAGEDMPLEDIGSTLDMMMASGGPFNLQLSGGEPTVRDDLPVIMEMAKSRGFEFLQLNTNGLRLANEQGYAEKLRDAGLNCVFLQFDSLKDDAYIKLRGRPLLKEKLDAIRNCADAGLGIVLVPVIAPGVNDDEIGELMRFALERMPAVRGVHFQPLSYFGRYGGAPDEYRVTIPYMLREIERQTGGLMKASDFAGGGAEHALCSFHADYRRSGEALTAVKTEASCCCSSERSRMRVASQWDGELKPEPVCCGADGCDTSELDRVIASAHNNTFAVSGMLFQDAWSLDLERLRLCYISTADKRYGMVPFCAYNLTSSTGKSLYR